MLGLPGAFFKNINLWTAVFTAAAAIASSAAAIITLRTAQSAERVAVEGQIQAQMSTYQTAYERLVSAHADPFNVNAYIALQPSEKVQVQIVDAMLVSVVDLMYQVDDPRAKIWATFIQGFLVLWRVAIRWKSMQANERQLMRLIAQECQRWPLLAVRK